MLSNLKLPVLIIGLIAIIVGFMLVIIFKHAKPKTNTVPTNTASLQTPTPLPQRPVTAQPLPHSIPHEAFYSHSVKK